jgi:RNA polymerase sigma-70 factor (TIGR02960 family)
MTTDRPDEMAAAIADDASAFAGLAERHRRELHVHCYRMLASFDEAEDAVQETMLRAWRNRASFEGGLFRAWLYRIATNVCLDLIRRRSRRLTALESFAEVPWLQPYPDRLLDEIAPRADEPDAVIVERETIELAFLAALQVLPARQRAALIARDVLGWPAIETAAVLETSVPAANSALQRARATMQAHLPARRADWSAGEPTDEERTLLASFIDAHERGDAQAAVAIAAQDLRITMPPRPFRFDGIEVIGPLMAQALGPEGGEWRLVPTWANRMPTAASYLRKPGDSTFRAFKFDVLRVVDGKIAEITTFDATLFAAFGLPPTL